MGFSCSLQNDLCMGGDVREGTHGTHTNTHELAVPGRRKLECVPFHCVTGLWTFPEFSPLYCAGGPYHNLEQLTEQADMQMKGRHRDGLANSHRNSTAGTGFHLCLFPFPLHLPTLISSPYTLSSSPSTLASFPPPSPPHFIASLFIPSPF